VRTENSKHGFSSILLAFAIVLSMTLSMTLTAPTAVAGIPYMISEPGGTTITCYPGTTFTVQFKLQWNESALGYFSLGIYWDSPKTDSTGTANENFTFVSASAYFEDNLQAITPLGTTFSEGVSPEDPTQWRYSLVVDETYGEGGNDNFYVNIVMRASGAGGVPHIAPNTDNIIISGTIDVAESTIQSYTPPDPEITIQVNQWTGGVIVRGKANAKNIDQGGILPYEWYTAGDNPPIMVAQRVDSGAFVAGGISSSCRNGRWNDSTPPANPLKGLDNLLHAAFQWMVPGADNVLWYENSVYNTRALCSQLVAALVGRGYDVDNLKDNLTSALLANYDILVIPQLQKGDKGAGGNPNDPDILAWTATINTWVRAGGGLVIMEGSDYLQNNWCRVQNKILDALDSPWWFQHDQVNDNVDNWGAAYEIKTDVDTNTSIGAVYQSITGWDDVGLYSCASLVEVPTFSVSVSVIPSTVQSGPEDSDFTWTATVTNNGANDNFLLSVSDSASPDWDNLSISATNVTIQGGNSYDATVTVSIPIGTPYCTYDTLTVTATSFTDSGVSASDTGQAHSTGAALLLRGVTVEIEPEHQEAVMIIDPDAIKKRYDPLTFKVIVTNTGYLDDKYIITATTPSDKMLELWPTELFLQPGKSDFVVLSVTVPEDEVGSNLNYITVEAVGTFATGTGDDTDNAAAFDTCTVHVQEAYCVRIDVWPFQTQTGTPGSKIRWIARVKNLGNTTNIYTISASALVYDFNRVYGPIPVTLTPDYAVIPPCNWAQVIIDIEIPLGLETSTMIDVLVEVQSLIEPQCYDYAEVDVHVVRSIPKIPQGVIKLEVETEIIAIQVWPAYWDFGVLDEAETASTPADYFTVRNIGNEPVNVFIRGNDANSSPGELVTTWLLDDLGNIGLDRYVLKWDSTNLTHADQLLFGNMAVSEERTFDLTITAPSSITVPSRMWTLVNLTALEAP